MRKLKKSNSSRNEENMDEIVAELEKLGYACKRNDDLLTAGTTLDFDPDDYPWVD